MRHSVSITLIIVFTAICLLATPSRSGGIGTPDRPSYWGEIILTAVVVVAIIYCAKVFGEKESKYDYVEHWVPVKVLMYGAKNKLMSRAEIEYESFKIGKKKDKVWVPVKNVSNVNTPIGKMKMEMVFENVRVNQGIKNSEFKI